MSTYVYIIKKRTPRHSYGRLYPWVVAAHTKPYCSTDYCPAAARSSGPAKKTRRSPHSTPMPRTTIAGPLSSLQKLRRLQTYPFRCRHFHPRTRLLFVLIARRGSRRRLEGGPSQVSRSGGVLPISCNIYMEALSRLTDST